MCSESSPIDARFCWSCGTALADDTGRDQDLKRYVPPEMLTKIRSAGSDEAMRGERRTVTMLFADVQGSTSAAESMDPEDWAEIINGAFERLIAPVYRYEGTLARLQGDAVLAFFGAPIAHEDDPVRAVMAGLDMVQAIDPYRSEIMEKRGVPLAIRVGINTGLVVVGEVGSDLRVEYTALGDAVNVAARMEQTADPGTVRVTEETRNLIGDRFAVEEIGLVEVKGKSEPVVAYRVDAPVALPDLDTETGKLVGRSAELERLIALRDQVVRGSGRLASLMGDAGVGKTRLLREFRTRTTEQHRTATRVDEQGDLAWIAASSRSYDSSVPYATIRELLARWWQLDDFEDRFQRVAEVVQRSSLSGVPDPALYLSHLVGATMPEGPSQLIESLEPPVRQARSRQALVAYLEAEAQRRPTLVALEDIHWSDALTLALIEDLMALADRVPIGLIFTMRPYRDEPSWHVHEVAQRDHPHRYEQVELTSLAEQEELLDVLFEGVDLDDDVRAKILARSDGNPLFIEQMARSIREGADDIAVPTGLMSVLTARLDRLDDESREVAQLASVLGPEFDRSVLAALTEDEARLGRVVGDLLRSEILVERVDAPGSLAFHHSLMQEAAYSTMLLRTRRELHARVADHLASEYPDLVEDIAGHLIDADNPGSAFPYLIEAGEKSSGVMALAESIRFLTTALDNMPPSPDPDLVVRAHDALGLAYRLLPDLTRTEAAYQSLVDYADNMGRPSDKVKALNQLAISTATISGDYDAARSYLDEAHAVASKVEDQYGLAQYHMASCYIAGLDGDLWTGAQHDEQTIETGRKMGSDEIRRAGMYALAENTAWLLDFERAGPAVEDALQAAIEAGDEAARAHVEATSLSQLKQMRGDIRGALELLVANEDTLIRYGDFEAPMVTWWAGVLQYQMGDIEAGVSRLDHVRREAMEYGAPMYAAAACASLAMMYAALGIEDDLDSLRSVALESLEKPLGAYQATTVWADLGFANLALGRLDEAEADFMAGEGAPSTTQFWEKPRLLVGKALVFAGDDPERAHSCLDEAQAFVLEKGVSYYDAMIGHARGVALLSEGKPSEALAKLTEAHEVASSSGWRMLAVEISIASARAGIDAGDTEAAAEHAGTARAEVDSIASQILSDDLRAAVERSLPAGLEEILSGH